MDEKKVIQITNRDILLNSGTGTTDGSGNLAITFERPFYQTPIVISNANSAGFFVSITAISTTTVTLNCKDHAGNNGTTKTIYWLAIERTAQ